MAAVSAYEFYPALKGLLGLPDNLVAFTLRMRANDVVAIECEYYPSLDNASIAALGSVFREYELVERQIVADPVAAPQEQAPAQDFDAWLRERTEIRHRNFMLISSLSPARFK